MNNMKQFSSLEDALQSIFGSGISVTGKKRVYGGDSNDAFRLTLSDGTRIFLKTNSIANADFFPAEALGLRALRRSGTIGVPEVLGMGTDGSRRSCFLLMEYIEQAPAGAAYWDAFGHQLAALHRSETACFVENGRYGFLADNFIGSSPQKNTRMMRWTEFYRSCRLYPQVQRAERYLDCAMRRQADALLDHLDRFLPEPEFPSLLHGDLWSGNAMCGADGRAWIFDPAVYVGHCEADLAMTQLFGEFPQRFYDAYHEVCPIDSGYAEHRDLYHLYHLLNHLNLFGWAYLGEVRDILKKYIGSH